MALSLPQAQVRFLVGKLIPYNSRSAVDLHPTQKKTIINVLSCIHEENALKKGTELLPQAQVRFLVGKLIPYNSRSAVDLHPTQKKTIINVLSCIHEENALKKGTELRETI